MEESTQFVNVKYLVIDAPLSYNIIIGHPALKTLEVVLSMLYLSMKYPLGNGHVSVIKGDQKVTMKCYKDYLKVKR